MGVEVGGIGSGVEGVSRDLKMRVYGSGATGNGVDNGEKIRNRDGYDKESAGKNTVVKHYDADGKCTGVSLTFLSRSTQKKSFF